MFTFEAKRHVSIVEAARGIAAAYVVLHHIAVIGESHAYLSSSSFVGQTFEFFQQFGKEAVLLFFLLSGFSIHYVSLDRRLDTADGLMRFYYLRARRIIPIFFVSAIFSLAVLGIVSSVSQDIKFPPASEIAATFLFLSDIRQNNGWIPTLESNAPLWSLSYEMFYYLLYPLLWVLIRRLGVVNAVGISAIVSLVALTFGKFFGPFHLTNLLIPYVLWCLGAYLAELDRRSIRFRIDPMLALTVIFLGTQSAWIFEQTFTWKIPGSYDLYCGFLFFAMMLLFLMDWAGRVWSSRQIRLGTLGVLVTTAAVVYTGVRFRLTVLPVFFAERVVLTGLLTSAWLWSRPETFQVVTQKLLMFFIPVGAFSYGLYVIHFPIMFLAESLGTSLLGLRFMCVPAVLVALAAAWVLECRFQPWIASVLDTQSIRLGLVPAPSAIVPQEKQNAPTAISKKEKPVQVSV